MTHRSEMIAVALGACRTTVRSEAPGLWALAVGCEPTFFARARIEGTWLLLDAPLTCAGFPRNPWALLEACATFPGGAAFAWSPCAAGLRVRADVILDDDVDVAARLPEAYAGLTAACARVAGSQPAVPDRQPATIAVDLPALARRTRWRPTEHDGAPVTIDLDVPGGFAQATSRLDPGLGVVLEAPVTDLAASDRPGASPTCHDALGMFLLRVNAALRGVRVIARPLDGPRFEAVLGSDPGPADLHHGCAALSVACRLASREAAVLARDEVVAGTYLARAHIDRQEE